MTTNFNAKHPRIGNGTFAEKVQSVSDVSLTDGRPTHEVLRAGADAFLADRVKIAAANELGGMQRRADKRNFTGEWPTTSPLTEKSQQWEGMDREQKASVLRRIDPAPLEFLLDDDLFQPGRIDVSDCEWEPRRNP